MKKLSEMLGQLDEVIVHYENKDADAAEFLRADLYREAREGLDQDDYMAFMNYNELVIAAERAVRDTYYAESAQPPAQVLEI